MTDQKEFSYPGIVERCYEFCAWLLPKIGKFPSPIERGSELTGKVPKPFAPLVVSSSLSEYLGYVARRRGKRARTQIKQIKGDGVNRGGFPAPSAPSAPQRQVTKAAHRRTLLLLCGVTGRTLYQAPLKPAPKSADYRGG
jgi:hypothetical protein